MKFNVSFKKILLFSIWIFILTSVMLCAKPVYQSYVTVDLVSEQTAVNPGVPFWVGLRMVMDKDWYTYWQNPGDSGLATKITWRIPDGFKTEKMRWPYPRRLDYPGVTSYGHGGEIYLLTQITPPATLSDTEVTLDADVRWLSCKQICIPGQARLSLTLPAARTRTMKNKRWTRAFARAQQQWPWETHAWSVTARPIKKFLRLEVIPPPDALRLTELAFFPLRDDIIDHQARQTFLKTRRGYRLDIAQSTFNENWPRTIEGVLVSKEGFDPQGTREAILIKVNMEH